jgi:hypothetical protein
MRTYQISRRLLSFCPSFIIGLLCLVNTNAMAQTPITSYSAITDSRLLNPEDQNWLSYRGNLSGWG